MIGRERAYQLLSRWLLSTAAESPFLLTGATEAAVDFARRVSLCLKPRMADTGVAEACSVCRGCRGALPADLMEIDPAAARVSIAAVRAVQRANAMRPLSGRRLIVLRRAERLSLPASQALLKFLEEGGAHTRWLLTSAAPQRLLPTVLSRCQRLRLPPAEAPPSPARLPVPPVLGLIGAAAELTNENMMQIGAYLLDRSREEGPTPRLCTALRRLTDYYRVAASGGNERLAREVLLASLTPFAP